MSIVKVKDSCTGCTACAAVCPKHCIQMGYNEEGFIAPKVDLDLCVECGLCEKHCHVLRPLKPNSKSTAYYGWHQDESIRAASSSGGAFSAIAHVVLENDGVVFGAIYDTQTKSVIHTDSTQVAFIKQRKSKYVESDLQDCYSRAKAFLKQGIMVLFSGTPCQIGGLYAFLGQDYDNLLTCDFICHGVAPMPFLNEHLEKLEGRYQSQVSAIDFRPKIYGWSTHSLKVSFQNQKQYHERHNLDTYFKGFMSQNLFLRKSCYECPYSENHPADIILADFWGWAFVNPPIVNDEKGISLLIANSKKGHQYIEAASCQLNIYPLDLKYTRYAFYKRNDMEKYQHKRVQFFEKVKEIGFEKAARKFYYPYPLLFYKLKFKLTKLLKLFRGVK